ncbi:polyphosphate kinase 2 family protein, partial [Streptomyces xanthochromogenes]
MAGKGKARKGGDRPGQNLRELLRIPEGERVDLASHATDATPGGPKDKAAGLAAIARMGERLADLQERLYAAST